MGTCLMQLRCIRMRKTEFAILASRASFISLGVLISLFVWNAYGPGYYSEYESILTQLRAIPNVELLDAGGHEDFLRFEQIWARIRVAGKGELFLCGLHESSFRKAPRICFYRIGPY